MRARGYVLAAVLGVVGASLSLASLSDGAQPKRAAPRATKKQAGRSAAKPKPKAAEVEEEAKDEEAPSAAAADKRKVVGAEERAGSGGPKVLETKEQGDGGVKTYKFGPVDVEGRSKSPQIVYFLRRVRAEFGAGELGHRSFMRELSDTRRSPALK